MNRCFFFLILSLSFITSCNRQKEKLQPEPELPPIGFFADSLSLVEDEVRTGDTFSSIMNRLGLDVNSTYELTQICSEDSLFDPRKVIKGKLIDAYYGMEYGDSLLQYVVYHNDRIHSTVFKCFDSLAVWGYDKPVDTVHLYSDITITSSLWADMTNAGVSPQLIIDLSDIYAWTVDFFGLQEGDRFRCIYNQRECEGEIIDIKDIEFAIFSRDTLNLYAINFDQGDGGNKYWNEKGESMRKAFLKAPLEFKRISSKFSYHRKHPVTGVVKAHTAVDYAAPTGTPVVALGDGTVISAGWGGGGGNTVKIRHNSVYTTGYLHLSKYGKGIKAGAHVKQGQVIGYVGSTGTATGPHLDFRVWKNGTPIDPLKLESPSAEPINEENRSALDSVFRVKLEEIGTMTNN